MVWAKRTDQRFDRIVGNPPYLPIRSLTKRGQRAALANEWRRDGHRVSKQGNVWLAFLLASVQLLKPRGSLAFILPAAWDYADYSRAARTELPSKFRDFRVIRSKRPLFDAVEEGSIVLVGNGFSLEPTLSLRQECAGLSSLITCVKKSTKNRFQVRDHSLRTSGTLLRDLLEIRIGAVTGDTKYFVLTDKVRRALNLPRAACRSVLSKARHLSGPSVDLSSWRRLRKVGEPVWLFRPSEKMLRLKSVRDYLALKQEHGGCRRSNFKIKHRAIWHQTPLPPRAQAFIAPSLECGPWLVFNDEPRLTATNTLYIARFRKAKTDHEKYALALAMLSSPVQRQVRQCQRSYAGGLKKLEPNDLMRLSLPAFNIPANIVRLYSRAVRAQLHGDSTAAAAIADSILLRVNHSSTTSEKAFGFPVLGDRRFP